MQNNLCGSISAFTFIQHSFFSIYSKSCTTFTQERVQKAQLGGGGKSWVEKGVRGAELNHTLYYTSETILHLN